MHSTLAVRAMRSLHPASSTLSSAAFRRAPLMAAAARPAMVSPSMTKVGLSPTLQLARRWNTQENKGGKAKLIFRFGLRDIPVELYPMAFVVAVACVGAAFAVGRHFYLDGLRTGPAGKTATTE